MGDHPPLRPPQTTALLDAMRTCPEELQIFTVAGNRDIGNTVAREMSWTGYSAQFMEEPGDDTL